MKNSQALPQTFEQTISDLSEHLKTKGHDQDSIEFVVSICQTANQISKGESQSPQIKP